MRRPTTIGDLLQEGQVEEARVELHRALVHGQGYVSRTAAYLGVSRPTVYRWLALCGITREDIRAAFREDKGSRSYGTPLPTRPVDLDREVDS